jgi:hypothetical protein
MECEVDGSRFLLDQIAHLSVSSFLRDFTLDNPVRPKDLVARRRHSQKGHQVSLRGNANML